MGRACSKNMGEEEYVEDIGGKAKRKETTGKTKVSVGEQCKMDLREVGGDCVDWIDLAQDHSRHRDTWFQVPWDS
jgi:hypothetical protein